jgi:hypothetical protein
MTRDNFILCLSAYLSEAGVEDPITEAARFVIDYPGIVDDTTPQDAAQEWCSANEKLRLLAKQALDEMVRISQEL